VSERSQMSMRLRDREGRLRTVEREVEVGPVEVGARDPAQQVGGFCGVGGLGEAMQRDLVQCPRFRTRAAALRLPAAGNERGVRDSVGDIPHQPELRRTRSGSPLDRGSHDFTRGPAVPRRDGTSGARR
jgi:hypothetical protein